MNLGFITMNLKRERRNQFYLDEIPTIDESWN